MFSAKKRAHQIAYAQNFLHSATTVKEVLDLASLSQQDTVLEIGTGKGIITKELAKRVQKVIGIEKDTVLASALKKELSLQSNIQIIAGDILHDVPLPQPPYLVFANPPFNISSQLIKFLLFQQYLPQVIYLFLQKEAAQRFLGKAHEYELSVKTKPWFTYEIIHQFKRDDFSPQPNVDVVLLKITQLASPLIPFSERNNYTHFVEYLFQRQKANAQKAFEPILTYPQWKRLAKNHAFNGKATIKELTINNWIDLYQYCSKQVIKEKQLWSTSDLSQ